MTGKRLPPDERHFDEPEIIPPGHEDGGELDSMFQRHGVFAEHSVRRVYVTRVGPLGLLPFVILGGVITAALLAFLFGFLLILIPAAALILAAAIIGSLLRGTLRWPR
ncbi:MAG: hypothetical protein L0Y57_04840 [Beijerinckiaceae bacterium]|nr:hypothetical protein [Beijerinckiaceae bacterium]